MISCSIFLILPEPLAQMECYDFFQRPSHISKFVIKQLVIEEHFFQGVWLAFTFSSIEKTKYSFEDPPYKDERQHQKYREELTYIGLKDEINNYNE